MPGRLLPVLLGVLMAAGLVAPQAHADSSHGNRWGRAAHAQDPSPRADPAPATVTLTSAKLGRNRARVVLRYHFTCPVVPTVAYLAGTVTERTTVGIVQSQNYREVTCTGRRQHARVVVPASSTGKFDSGPAVVQSEISADNEPGSWQGSESTVVRLVPGKVLGTKVLTRSSLPTATPGDDTQYLRADVSLVGTRMLADGAGLEVSYDGTCPSGFFSYVFTTVQQDGRTSRGTLELICSGSTQRLVSVVAVPEGPPLHAGAATVTGVLNNCGEQVGCFRAEDTETVTLERGTAWWARSRR